MKRLGLALQINANNNILVRVETVPKIGDNVVDERLRPVGKILDIFGAVPSPYVTIKPYTRSSTRLLNKPLYISRKKMRKRRVKK